MHTKQLREIAKFMAGLIFGDFLFGLWIAANKMLPLTFLGITLNSRSITIWLFFDALLIAFLAHYGWRMHHHARTRREKRFHIAAGIIFVAVAVLHIARILFGLPLVIGGWHAPYWANALGALATTFLAYASFRLAKRQ